MAAQNLVRLWLKTGEKRYAQLAEKTIQSQAGPLQANPSSLSALADALAFYLDEKAAKK